MKRIFLLFLLLGLALATKKDKSHSHVKTRTGLSPKRSTCNCGQTIDLKPGQRRIVGGTNASPHEFPFISGLSLDFRPEVIFCGSTVITKRHAITASHCNPGPEYAISVILGEHDTDTSAETKTVRISIKQFINHEEYNSNGKTNNDIALLVLAQNVPFGYKIRPVCFPKNNLDLVGQKVRMAGWGTIAHKGPQANILQKVDLDVIPLSNCTKTFASVTEKQICTYTLNQDGCQGDSGGPVIQLDPTTNRYTLVGIVSYGVGCAKVGYPGVNTNVAAYSDWVHQKIAETDPKAAVCSK